METLDIIQSIGVLASLGFAAWQMYCLRMQIKSATDIELTNKLDNVNQLIFDNVDSYKKFDGNYPTGIRTDDYIKVDLLLQIIFNTFEQAHVHHKKYKHIDKEDWKTWELWLNLYIKKPYIKEWWNAHKTGYSSPFNHYIESLMTKS